MKAQSSLSSKARSVRVVLTDIDDTVITEGMLTAAAYGALEQLHRPGFLVIPVTDRQDGAITSPARGRSAARGRKQRSSDMTSHRVDAHV